MIDSINHIETIKYTQEMNNDKKLPNKDNVVNTGRSLDFYLS